jgi:hypothetical protein
MLYFRDVIDKQRHQITIPAMGGVPGKLLKDGIDPWTEEQPYKDEYERCEELKANLNIKL